MKTKLKKIITRWRTRVFSRHPSHNPLRRELPLMPCRSVVRLGSTTEIRDGRTRVEVNSVESIRNSASKLRMKQCFSNAGVKTAKWTDGKNKTAITALKFPIIAKSHYGSRGIGNTKLDTVEQFEAWCKGKVLAEYIFEEFVSMSREYRLHVTSEGCFYTCRKLLREDAPENTWQRHDDVCIWALETNTSFKKPKNWNAIVADCVKALNSLGLDIGAFDVMVQGSKNGEERAAPEWNICESCSAPSFGEITTLRYIEEIPKIIKRKLNQ